MKDRPEACNLIQLYSAISDISVKDSLQSFGGKEFRFLKEVLSEKLINVLVPIGKEINRLLEDEIYLLNMLDKGSKVAKKDSENNFEKIKEIVGFI